MSITLDSLVAQLRGDLPPYNNLPATEQYQQAVKEAVQDYGLRTAVSKVWTLSVVAGTAAYDLPADFARLINVLSLTQMIQNGVIVTGSGIIPMSTALPRERFAVRGGKLTISPTPTYSLDRSVIYGAGFPLVDDAYAELTDADVNTLIHKARALALNLIATGVARFGWRYSLADESVDKTMLPAALRDQAKAEESLYEAALTMRGGGSTQTIRADYAAGEYS